MIYEKFLRNENLSDRNKISRQCLMAWILFICQVKEEITFRYQYHEAEALLKS